MTIPILLAAFFNLLIDPFSTFQTPTYQNFNTYKLLLNSHNRLHRAVDIARQQPDAIFLGSSRVMAGLDPTDLKKFRDYHVYNSGFNGAAFEEVYAYFEHALYYQPQLKLVVLGIDLFQFGKNQRPLPGFAYSRLKEGTFSLSTWLSLIFSKTSVLASLETWRRNRQGEQQHIFQENGLLESSAIENDYLYNKANLFAAGDELFLNKILTGMSYYYQFQLEPKHFERFRRLVERCQQQNIELQVFICPSKVSYWETLYRHNHWNALEDFKRQISAIYPVWDFSGYNGVTTEQSEIAHQKCYYDCSHFTPFVGRYILDQMFGQDNALQFGYLITTETIETVLHQIKEDRLQWLSTHPAILSTLPTLNETVD